MSVLLRLIIVVSLFQLSWWQASISSGLSDPWTACVLTLGLLAGVYGWLGRPLGMGLAALLGLGYLGPAWFNYPDVIWHDLPLAAWAGLVICSCLLHGWVNRRRRRMGRGGYERLSGSTT
ncbi:MAG: hypothetical protein O2968_19825 [Acidobacteria bacterium]|nr:hypothetical protein [Acidobacteriota bacterium]